VAVNRTYLSKLEKGRELSGAVDRRQACHGLEVEVAELLRLPAR
jgi:hypothetical protein